MASVTVTVSADVAMRMDTNLAAGAGPHLPVGNWSGAEYRSAMRFTKPTGWQAWVGPYSGSSITKATLSFYISDHAHVGVRNSSIYVRRTEIGDPWTKGAGSQDCNNGFTSGNNTQSGDVNAATTDQVSFSSGSTANAKKSVTVTAMVRTFWAYDQAPVFIFDNVGSDDYTELWADEKSGYNAELVIEYDDAVAPTAPSLNSPVGGVTVDGTSPRLSWTHNHPQGDAQTEAHVRVFDAGGTQIGPTYTIASATNYFDVPALARGASYRWDVQTRNATVGYGPYAAYQTFAVRANPVVTISAVRKMVFANGAPRLMVEWTTDQPQSAYQVSAPGYDTGTVVSGSQSQVLSTLGLTYGSAVSITVTSASVYGGAGSASISFTPRWGLTTQRKDLGAEPIVGYQTPQVGATVPVDTYMPIEYGSSDIANATPTGGWYSDLANVPIRRHLHFRVWFIPSATQSPTLDYIVININRSVQSVDHWYSNFTNPIGPPWKVDTGEYVYGTRSMTVVVDGVSSVIYSRRITVRKGRSYLLTGLMKSQGQSSARLLLIDPSWVPQTAPDGATIQTPAINETRGWFDATTNDTYRYKTPVYVADADKEVVVVLVADGAVGSQAWFDAIKLEESTVATPWSPGAIGAASIDAGGVQVDGSRGGVFRYKGRNGGLRDVVEGGAMGLVFGGDAEVRSQAPAELWTNARTTIEGGSFGAFYAAGNQRGYGAGGFFIQGDGASGDKWAKIATGQLDSQYNSHSIKGTMQSRYHSAVIEAIVTSDAGIGSQPSVRAMVQMLQTLDGNPVNAKVIVEGLNPIRWSLWFYTVNPWGEFYWHPTDVSSNGYQPTPVDPKTTGFVAPGSLPAGTQYDALIVGPTARGIGFPSAMFTGQRFIRLDIGNGLEFTWTGSNWVTVQSWPLHFSPTNPAGAAATQNNAAWVPIEGPFTATGMMPYIDKLVAGWTTGGGTSLGASHMWWVQFHAYNYTGGAYEFTNLAIDYGLANVGYRATKQVGWNTDGGGAVVARMNLLKVGTPGNLFVGATLWMRGIF